MSNEQEATAPQSEQEQAQPVNGHETQLAATDTSPDTEQSALEQNGLQNGAESVNGDGEKDGEGEQVPGSVDIAAEPEPSDDPAQKFLHKRQFVVQELIDTERDYARDLGQVVLGYMVALKEMQLPEDFQGKDKIVFGNIQQIYEFHRDTFSQELEKCLQAPDRVGSPFVRYERRLSTIYVKYCENKPKSDYIVSEYIDTIFEDVRQKLGHRLQLQDLLIKPVQRIMKYQLLLKDIMKHSERAGADCSELKRALDVMHRVPKEANDMMQVGRLQGFPGKITALGKLLLQDTLQVAVVTPLEPTPKYKERRVFLFEQMIVFSDVSERKRGPVTYSTYTYKNSAEINNMKLRDRLEPPESESVKFMIMHRAKDGTETKFYVDPLNDENRATWMHSLNVILSMQRDFLTALQDPKQYLKGLSGSDEKPAASNATPPTAAKSDSAKNTDASSTNSASKPTLQKSFSTTTNEQAPNEHRGSNASGRSTTAAACTKKKNLFGNFLKGGNKKSSNASQTSAPTAEADANESKARPVERKHKQPAGCKANKLLVNASAVNAPDCQPLVKVVEAVSGDASKEQLSVQVGEQLQVLNCNDSGTLLRVRCDASGAIGWVPLSALAMADAVVRSSATEPEASAKQKGGAKKAAANGHEEEKQTSVSFSLKPTANTFVRQNETASLQCGVTSKSKVLLVCWTRPDAQVVAKTGTEQSWTFSELDETSTLTLAALQPTSAGRYTCLAITPESAVASASLISVGQCPAPPAKPLVSRKGEKAVILSWKAAEAADCDSTTLIYVIEARHTSEKHWRLITAHCAYTSHVVEDVDDGNYCFRIRAANAFGLSSPSEPTDEINLSAETDACSTVRGLWKTDFEQHFVNQQKLHEGQLSMTALCKLPICNTSVIVKHIKKQTRTKDAVTADTYLLHRLSVHPRFCKLLDHFDTNIDWVFVFEHCPEGNLPEFMVKKYGKPEKDFLLSEQQGCVMTAQLLDAVLYLNSKRIVHLRIKPESVLLFQAVDGWSIKLGSFDNVCSTDVPAEMLAKLIIYANSAASGSTRCSEEIEFASPFMLTVVQRVKENNADAKSLAVPSELAHADFWSTVLMIHLLLRGQSLFYDASYDTTAELISQHLAKSADKNTSEAKTAAAYLAPDTNAFLERSFDALSAKEGVAETLKALRADKWFTSAGLKRDELPSEVIDRLKESSERRLKYHRLLCSVCATESTA